MEYPEVHRIRCSEKLLCIDDFPRVCDRQAAESLRTLKRKGIDPLKTVIDYAHSLGLELHGTLRTGSWAMPAPIWNENKFYREHPEWRCVDRDGQVLSCMSYALPGVQDYVIALLREVVERGADGVSLAYPRGLPVVWYEQPVVDGFQQRYGEDPRELPEDDPRWLEYRASRLTEFMKRLRQEMDRLGEQLGRRVQISAYVLDNVLLNLEWGLDVAACAREGVVDFVMPHPWRTPIVDLPSFIEATRGTNCEVVPDVLPGGMSPAEYREKVLAYYQLGIEKLAFWDVNGRYLHLDEWSMIRRLGHKDELAGWEPDQWPAYGFVHLRKVGGQKIDRYSPFWSG